MSSMLATLDSSMITALANNAELKSKREGLRGGAANGQGVNLTTGRVPELDETTGRYGLPDRDFPALFNTACRLRPMETEAIEYELLTVLLLPHLVEGAALADGDMQQCGELVLNALINDDPLNSKSLASLLLADPSVGAAVDWRVGQVSLTGPETQPRIEVQTVFSIPASTILARTQGIVEGT